MVGPPKTLQDLRKVEGAVRVTCRECKRVNLLDREEMILMRLVGRNSCDWPNVVQGMRCPDCVSANVKVQVEAYGEGLPALRRRRAAMITIELALKILSAASYSGSRRSVPVEAVRLALRALHPHLADRGKLERFWERYANVDHLPLGDSPAGCYRDIVTGLLKRGYAVPGELRAGS